MTTRILKRLYVRELGKLSKEISLYQSEENLWKIDRNISNSGGNLCLHLLGNLNHFVGAVIGKTGYVRNRELEFSQKDVPKDVLLRRIDETTEMVTEILSALDDIQLEKDYPIEVLQGTDSTQFILTHLLSHLSYHLGQINYHRRLLDN